MKRTLLITSVVITVACAQLQAQKSLWEPFHLGLLNLAGFALDADPVDTLVLYAGTEYGNVYKSSDGGFTWQLKRNGIPSGYDNERVTAIQVDKSDRNRIYAGFSGRQSTKNLFCSTDGGESWKILPTPDSWQAGGVLRILTTRGPVPRVFVGLGWSTGIWVSSDSGLSWNRALNNLGIQALAGHPRSPNTLYAGSSAQDVIGPLVKSTDGGNTWKTITKGITYLDPGTGVRSLTVDPSDTNRVYAGLTDYDGLPNGLFCSTDGGESWSQSSSNSRFPKMTSIAVHPGNSNLIYISDSYSGAVRTSDGGQTWTHLDMGSAPWSMMQVIIAPGYPVSIFVIGENGGISRLVDEEIPEDMIRR